MSFRHARSFYCRCGTRYLWECRSSFGTDEDGGVDFTTLENSVVTFRDWYRPDSESVGQCQVCGTGLLFALEVS
jgi:hypothetical protein